MATKTDEAKAEMQVTNSRRGRKLVGVKRVTASMNQKRDTLARKTGRALHGRTKSHADAKAGKPGDG